MVCFELFVFGCLWVLQCCFGLYCFGLLCVLCGLTVGYFVYACGFVAGIVLLCLEGGYHWSACCRVGFVDGLVCRFGVGLVRFGVYLLNLLGGLVWV